MNGRSIGIKSVLQNLILIILFIAFSLLMLFLLQHYYRRSGLPILGYHSVERDEIYSEYFVDNPYVTSQSSFDKQMKYLYDSGYKTLSLDEAEKYYRGELNIGQKSVCLTFDDGMENFNTVAKPILDKYGFKATCFVIGSKTLRQKSTDPSQYRFLAASDIKPTDTVKYYSHSYDLHRRINGNAAVGVLSYDEICDDFEKNKSIVSDDYFAYPYGISSKTVKKYLQNSNTHIAFSYANNRNMLPSDDPLELPRYLIFNHMPMAYFMWMVQ